MRDANASTWSAVVRRLTSRRLTLLLLLFALAGCDQAKEEACAREFGLLTRPGTASEPNGEGLGLPPDLGYIFCLLSGGPSTPGERRPATEATTATFIPISQQTANHKPTAVSCSSDRCAALNASPTGVNICGPTTCDFVSLPFGTGALQFSPDGLTLMAGGGANFRILEFSGPAAPSAEAVASAEALPSVRTLVVPGSFQPGLFAVPAIAFDPITARAHVCTSSGIVVLDAPYTAVAFTVPLGGAGLASCAGVAVAPDGSRIAATRNNNTVRFFAGPLVPGSTPQTLFAPIVGSGPNLLGLAFARDGSKLVVAANSAPEIFVIEPPYGSSSTMTKLTIPGVGPANGWTDVTFNPTNSFAVATGGTPAAVTDPGIAVGAFPFAPADFSRIDVPGGRGGGAARFLEEAPCSAPAAPAAEALTKRRGRTGSSKRGETELAGIARAMRGPTRGSTEVVGPLVAAVLPLSRSVRVGCPATAFVTVINSGSETATGVSIAPATSVPALFLYQTTDANNALTGTPNTPVNIPPGGTQAFVIAFTPTAPFPPTQIAFTIAGTNVGGVGVLPNINTLLLAASPARTGDPVALAATPGNDGIVDIPGPNGTGVFAVATVNVGINSVFTVSADTGGVALPVNILVCQTNTATAECLANPAPSVQATVAANATPSFAFFVQGKGVVAFDPAVNRGFVRIRDLLGRELGSTGVALQTVAAAP